MRRIAIDWPAWSAVVLVSVFLMACEGGGSSGGSGGIPAVSNPIDGTFIDAKVEGIEYLTFNDDLGMVHLSGMTDREGTYQFEHGEFIIFSVGSIVLGAARAKAVMTPADLVPENLDAQSSQDHLLNLLRLLQTLDVDGDANNGISVPELARNTDPGSEIDFSVPTIVFGASLDLQTYIGQVTNVSSLTDAATALAHFEESVAALVDEGYEDPRLNW